MWHSNVNRSRWLKTDQVITQWLQERQSLLVTYYEVCQQQSQGQMIDSLLLQSLCQLLVDYVSMGHFRAFEKMAEAQSLCGTINAALDSNLITQILRRTLAALDFNDKYETLVPGNHFAKDLSELGQNLAHRFDEEDKLIQNYLNITDHFVTTPSAVSF